MSVHAAVADAFSPAGRGEIAVVEAAGDEFCAAEPDKGAGGGENIVGHAVPGGFTIGKDAHGASGTDFAQTVHGGGGAVGTIAARSGRYQPGYEFGNPAQAEEMLAGDEMDVLFGKAQGQKQGIQVCDMVGNDETGLIDAHSFTGIIVYELQKWTCDFVQDLPDCPVTGIQIHFHPSKNVCCIIT